MTVVRIYPSPPCLPCVLECDHLPDARDCMLNYITPPKGNVRFVVEHNGSHYLTIEGNGENIKDMIVSM